MERHKKIPPRKQMDEFFGAYKDQGNLDDMMSSLSSSFNDHSPVFDSLDLTKHANKTQSQKIEKKELLLIFLLQALCRQQNPTQDFFISLCQKLQDVGYLSSEKYKDFDYLKEHSKSLLLEILHTWPTKTVKRSRSLGSIEELSSESSLLNLPLFNLLFYSRSRYKTDFKEMELIGKGGFGRVFRAMHKLDSTEYAIKKIKFSFKNMKELEEIYAKLIREVKTLASLNHNNIVNYNQSWFEPGDEEEEEEEEEDTYTEDCTISINKDEDEDIFKMESNSFDEESGPTFKYSKFSHLVKDSPKIKPQPTQMKETETMKNMLVKLFNHQTTKFEMVFYIQMELCSNETLEDWLWSNNRCVNIKDNYKYLEQLLKGLIYIHSKHLIHRDIKPQNIFLDKEGNLKIGDFGLATSIEKNVNYDKRTSGVGTLSYGAPEQLNSTNYNEKCDIYSLGLIIYEMFHPFKTKSERIQIIQDVKKCKFPKDIWDKYKKEMEIVKKCLSLNPDQRPSAVEILNALQMDPIKDQIIKEQQEKIKLLLEMNQKQEERIQMLLNQSNK